MILLAFAHPVTAEQVAQLESLTGQTASRVIHVPIQLDQGEPFAPQLRPLVDGVGLTAEEWQTEQIVVVPPSFSPITALLLAHLHGRMGYFPPVARLRPVPGAVPPRFEVGELLDLAAERAEGRKSR